MAVRLRLRRTGSRRKACFRVVAADARQPRDGRFIEVIGLYDPRHEEEKLNLDRVDYWLGQGAQPSRTVADIIRRVKARGPEDVAAEPKASEADVAVVEEPTAVEAEAPAEEEAPAEAEAAADAPAENAEEASAEADSSATDDAETKE